MIKILFVCHGNICRSPMAEALMKYYSKEYGIDKFVYTESMATSSEELGNDIYPPVKRVLDNHRIPYERHRARKISGNALNEWDLIICMDEYNLRNLKHLLGESNKIHKLPEFSGSNVDVDDPWYTREFEECFQEISIHIKNLCLKVLNKIQQ